MLFLHVFIGKINSTESSEPEPGLVEGQYEVIECSHPSVEGTQTNRACYKRTDRQQNEFELSFSDDEFSGCEHSIAELLEHIPSGWSELFLANLVLSIFCIFILYFLAKRIISDICEAVRSRISTSDSEADKAPK
ncbi:hypothetical protein VCUG_00798 [Vavraia culicis subsp. floridensis]|uniref:Uncharacterized protein n=1 Tax=Vavraia culicis (isolate floridensis) TaxID=948595 RepID=L2GVL1_VAVCU|nr:uncharacterized protein VCUG_00798 [Vavraia culicis subsp. floridensis]ELA47716.1 hypothetical protein VCUG_00798 [Vavraia culicis subsp. floridensis]